MPFVTFFNITVNRSFVKFIFIFESHVRVYGDGINEMAQRGVGEMEKNSAVFPRRHEIKIL